MNEPDFDISEQHPPTLGVYAGVVVAVRPSGCGQVQGFTGPHVVLLPGRLMNGTRVGDEIRYDVIHRPGHGLPVVSRLLHRRP